MKLFPDVNVVLQTKFDLLLPLQNLFILIFEKNRTKVVEFWHQSDKFFVILELELFEKGGDNSVITIDKFKFNRWVER